MLVMPSSCDGCEACESVELIAVAKVRHVILKGFSEFGSQSTPPRYYRKYSVSGGWTWTRDREDGSPVWTEVGSGSGLSPWSWSASTGELADPSGLSDSTRVDTNSGNITHAPFTNYGLDIYNLLSHDPGIASGASYTSGNSYGDVVAGSGDEFPATYTVDSKTQATFTQSGGTSSPDSISSGTFVYTLSDEDTEADAFARTDYEEYRQGEYYEEEIISLRENRDDTSDRFTDIATKFAAICGGLTPENTYRLVVELERRTALGFDGFAFDGWDAEYGEWEDTDDYVSDEFEADAESMIIGGTWSDANSDSEIQEDEVVPEIDLPKEDGYEYRVKRAYLEAT